MAWRIQLRLERRGRPIYAFQDYLCAIIVGCSKKYTWSHITHEMLKGVAAEARNADDSHPHYLHHSPVLQSHTARNKENNVSQNPANPVSLGPQSAMARILPSQHLKPL
jgi:hypothetical protein